MALLISASIDLSKIVKSKIQTVDKNGNPYKNGQKYYNIQISVNDDIDQYQNNVGITEPQTKEQRDQKEKRVYLGNGRVVWSNLPKVGNDNLKQAEHPNIQEPTPPTTTEDDLPF